MTTTTKGPAQAPVGSGETTQGWPTSVPRPSLAQLVRLRRRLEKAHDALDNASYYLLEAGRVYDGDKIPTKFPHAMAWEEARSVEAAIDCLTSLLASAEGYADAAIKETKGTP